MDYEFLTKQLAALTEDCPFLIANLSNTAALLWQSLPQINWVGFYMCRKEELILGPFQGKPACIRIPVGKGVCGTAILENQVQRVADVHAFPGHIACDCESRSEMVIPLHVGGKLWGVLDIDSPAMNRFTESDQKGLETVCREIEKYLCRNVWE